MASSEILTESVLIYVTRPSVPLPFISIPSYSCWATIMDLFVVKFSLFAASCCRLLVVNGAKGLRCLSFLVISETTYSPAFRSASTLSASSLLPISSFLPLYSEHLASKPFPLVKWTLIFQYSFGIKFFIWFSLSQIIFKAADCTLPALSPLLIFLHRSGLISYPTSLSRTLLACWASTSFRSMGLGCFTAALMVSFVISLNTIRQSDDGSMPSRYARCHEIASPSRSGSVAR